MDSATKKNLNCAEKTNYAFSRNVKKLSYSRFVAYSQRRPQCVEFKTMFEKQNLDHKTAHFELYASLIKLHIACQQKILLKYLFSNV